MFAKYPSQNNYSLTVILSSKNYIPLKNVTSSGSNSIIQVLCSALWYAVEIIYTRDAKKESHMTSNENSQLKLVHMLESAEKDIKILL